MSSPIPRDELTVLAAFAAVADERSFTKAAINLGVSRSAISPRYARSRSGWD